MDDPKGEETHSDHRDVEWTAETLRSEQDQRRTLLLGDFESIGDLVRYHMATKEPLTSKSGAKLLNPIPRQSWEISHDQIKAEKKIGEGQFGTVYRGTLKQGKHTTEVAVKTCRGNPTQAQRLGIIHKLRDTCSQMTLGFMKEARIMRKYYHPNIIRIYGVAAQQSPLMLVLEYVPGGSLKEYLKQKANSISAQEKINIALDAAKGMEYLESQGCIHRDLAARNCLLGKKNQLKICDFGLSRNQDIYRLKGGGKRKLPVKWLAPETLTKSIYTTKSDVWAYGVLLWEIFSNGSTPYEGMSSMNVFKMVSTEKYRMTAPNGTPKEITRIMNACWEHLPEKRPTFSAIRNDLESIGSTTITQKQ